MNRLLVFITFLLMFSTASAQTQFIKYKNYLIPIGSGVTVTTGGFSNVQNTSAILELILESGEDGTLVWFEFGTTNQIECADPERSPFSERMDLSEGETFSTTVTGLIADTIYFYRACAVSDGGANASGAIRQFKTTNVINVSTTTPDDVTLNSATLRASLTAGRNIRVWFALSAPNGSVPGCSSAPSNAFVGSVANSGAVQVSLNVTNLVPGARYGYRACAQNNASGGSIVSGSSVGFRTSDAPTEVETLSPPIQIEANSVTLQGKIVSGTNVDAFFVLDDNINISCTSTTADNSPVRNVNTGEIVEIEYSKTNQRFPRKDLLSNTKYYYRFCAEGSQDNDEGMVESFVTDGDGGAMTLDSTATRTDDSLRVTGRLTRTGQPKNTWFVVLEGNVSINDNTCSVPRENDRRGAKVLSSTADTNVFTANNLDDNAIYTVGFCGEGISAGTGEVSLGGRRAFATKRNSNTFVIAACGTGKTYSSLNGPLNIRITQSNLPSVFDSSIVKIANRGSRSLRTRVNRSVIHSAALSGTIDPWTEVTGIIAPVVIIGTNQRRYEVSINNPSSGTWDATFSCVSRKCVNVQDRSCAPVINKIRR